MREPTHVTISMTLAKRIKYILKKDLAWCRLEDGDDIDGAGQNCPHEIDEIKEALTELLEDIDKAKEDAMTPDFFKDCEPRFFED